MNSMRYLSQRDPRWAATKLGGSALTVGRFGCTTTCLSMLSDYFGHWLDPASIAEHRDWYTKGGLVIWGKLAMPGMQHVGRLRYRSDTSIMRSLKNPNLAVMLEVNYGAHWVVAVRKTFFGTDYLCIDPWTGKVCTAVGDYKNITGSAHFQRS